MRPPSTHQGLQGGATREEARGPSYLNRYRFNRSPLQVTGDISIKYSFPTYFSFWFCKVNQPPGTCRAPFFCSNCQLHYFLYFKTSLSIVFLVSTFEADTIKQRPFLCLRKWSIVFNRMLYLSSYYRYNSMSNRVCRGSKRGSGGSGRKAIKSLVVSKQNCSKNSERITHNRQ